MSEEKILEYNPESEIMKIILENKITFSSITEYEDFKIANMLNLVHKSLIDFLKKRNPNGHYIITVKNPETQAKYPLTIHYAGKKEEVFEEVAEDSYEERIRIRYLELIKEKKMNDASEHLCKYVLNKLSVYTIKDDLKSEVWVYKDGIYVPHGQSEIRKLLRNLLGRWYTKWIFGKVMEKVEPDTFIEPQNFFNINYINEIPVENGILDVNENKLKEFDPKKIFFNKLPVKFDKDAKCDKIEEFLGQVLKNEEDKKVFFELAGFGLIKEYFIEKSCMMVGNGRNGKSKCIELLKRLIGIDNCCSVPLHSLDSNSFSISELFSKMLNLAGDIGNQDLKETNLFKSLTGRDVISGKRKFQNEIKFVNYAKFIFACNELPMVYDMSKGFWDRWILLEFPYTFVHKKEYEESTDKEFIKIRNNDIINEITSPEEMSGFLNQALLGLKRLNLNKEFSSTQGSEQVKKTWIKKSNSFIAFCYDNIEEDPNGKISKKVLRRMYSKYCKENKIATKSDVVIKRFLQDSYGVYEDRIKGLGDSYEWFWGGIRLKNPKNDEN